MKHAREDYNRIQDPAGLIPEDEPVFLLRAQDQLACKVVAYYATLCEKVQAPEIAAKARMHSDLMAAWPKKKIPDLPSEYAAESETKLRKPDYWVLIQTSSVGTVNPMVYTTLPDQNGSRFTYNLDVALKFATEYEGKDYIAYLRGVVGPLTAMGRYDQRDSTTAPAFVCPYCKKSDKGWLSGNLVNGWRFTGTGAKEYHCDIGRIMD
jgi:hypothetical protein